MGSNPTDSNMDSNQTGSNNDPNQTSSSSGDQLIHLEGVSRTLSLSIDRLPLRQLQSTTRIDAGQEEYPHNPKRDASDWGDRYNEHFESIGDAPANCPPTRRSVNDPTSTRDTSASRPAAPEAAEDPPALGAANRPPTRRGVNNPTSTRDTPANRPAAPEAAENPPAPGDPPANFPSFLYAILDCFKKCTQAFLRQWPVLLLTSTTFRFSELLLLKAKQESSSSGHSQEDF
jgi:hypothetical protein